MRASRLLLPPGTLRGALLERSRHALACGAMQTIETVEEIVPDQGVDFVVRRVSSLARKQEDTKRRSEGAPANPFLPHEPDLFVAEISDTHFALLNKFNVIEGHLLVVTRRFVHQETLLDAGDFAALAACMAEYESLGFYNGGAVAGASQPHKHLQLVPLPLAKTGLPMEALFAPLHGRTGIARVPGLEFSHAFARLEPLWFEREAGAAQRLHALYLELLAAAGIESVRVHGEVRQSAPYNLLLTRRWMLLVPRSKEHFGPISVNALGYAGSLFVRDEEQMDLVRRIGPMALLRGVSVGGT